MLDIRARNYFCRIHKTNVLKEGKIHKYNTLKIYKQLCDKYEKVIFITHDKGTDNEHTHFLIQHDNQIRKSALLKIMPYGSIEPQKGSNRQVYEYMLHIDDTSRKNGKIEYFEKDITHNIENINEWLELKNGKGSRNDLVELTQMIEAGASDYEIIQQNKEAYARYNNYILKTRRAIIEQKGKQEREPLKVYYFYGDTGTGKSYTARHNHDRQDIFVVTDYKNPFDNYKGQKVLVLEEYRSNFNITSLLNYLDHYELELPARYQNNYACYEIVYIISNISPQDQYLYENEATKKAFYRRITTVEYFTDSKIKTFVFNQKKSIFELFTTKNNPKNSLDWYNYSIIKSKRQTI